MFVLDAWALMALFDDEPAAERVEAGIGTGDAVVSWINLGEAYSVVLRRRGESGAGEALRSVARSIRTEVPDAELVLAAARIKAGGRLSSAVAFCVATAQRHRAPLWTGDPELVALTDLVDVVDLREAS